MWSELLETGAAEVIIQINRVPSGTNINDILITLDPSDGTLEGSPTLAGGVYKRTYKAPLNYVRNGNSDDLTQGQREITSLQVTINGKEIPHPTFTLKKPPVVLLHGIWDYPSTWRILESRLRSNYGYEDIINIGYFNSASFSQISAEVQKRIINAIVQINKKNFACKKADIVGHSMGGLIAKLLNNEKNIRSIVTVGTPHYGSPLADFLWGLVDDAENDGNEKLIADILSNIGHSATDGAIKDLRVTGGQHCSYNPCLNQVPHLALAGISNPLDPFYFAFRQALLFIAKIRGFLNWSDDYSKLNELLFDEPNDWIVSITSQYGDSGNRKDEMVEWHIKEPQNSLIISDIINFLHGKPLSSENLLNKFNNSFYKFSHRGKPSLPSKRISNPEDFQITTPMEGQLFSPGDTVTVSFSINSLNPKVLIGASTGETGLLNSVPYTFSFQVKNDAIGPLAIIAGAEDNQGFIGEAKVTINIQTTATLNDLIIYPNSNPLYLLSDMEIPLEVFGLYSDSIERNITSPNLGTQYNSSDPNIVEISPEGKLKTKSIGEALITVSSSGVAKEFQVIVINEFSPNKLYLPLILRN